MGCPGSLTGVGFAEIAVALVALGLGKAELGGCADYSCPY